MIKNSYVQRKTVIGMYNVAIGLNILVNTNHNTKLRYNFILLTYFQVDDECE